MTNAIQEGDAVLCRRGNIDKNLGEGLVGVTEGFAQFSQYHGREVYVRFGKDHIEPHPADGWFWLSDVEPATNAAKRA